MGPVPAMLRSSMRWLGLGHGNVVDAVRMFHCGSRLTERDDHPLDEPAVYQIAQQKADQTYNQQQHEMPVKIGPIKTFFDC